MLYWRRYNSKKVINEKPVASCYAYSTATHLEILATIRVLIMVAAFKRAANAGPAVISQQTTAAKLQKECTDSQCVWRCLRIFFCLDFEHLQRKVGSCSAWNLPRSSRIMCLQISLFHQSCQHRMQCNVSNKKILPPRCTHAGSQKLYIKIYTVYIKWINNNCLRVQHGDETSCWTPSDQMYWCWSRQSQETPRC